MSARTTIVKILTERMIDNTMIDDTVMLRVRADVFMF